MKTLLTLAHSNSATRFYRSPEIIKGKIVDGKKATLINCVVSSSASFGYDEEQFSETKIFPNYIVFGNQWIDPNTEEITEIEYYPKDIDCLAAGSRDFGSFHPDVNDFQNLIEKKEAQQNKRAEEKGWNLPERPELKIGTFPCVLYYADNFHIVKVVTDECEIEVSNYTTSGPGSARGVKIDNQIKLKISLKSPMAFDAMINFLIRIHSFFELCIGKRQEYGPIKLNTKSSDSAYPDLELHWSHANERTTNSKRITYPADVLTNFVGKKEEFSILLRNWLKSSKDMAPARNRFGSSFYAESYGPDRVIGAANMFDLLPFEKAPVTRELDPRTQELVKECKIRFKKIPEGFAREEVLSALGRVGKASLKDKISHRVDILI